jgi:hypothetical protein
LSYFTQKDANEVLSRLVTFENALAETFERFGYDLRDNLGRRNALISQAQEKEVAAVLGQKYKEVLQDGAPGQPDVVIVDINKELECKLTSGHGSGTKSFDLQTDWETLCKKESLDYLYILANPDFTDFCVLFFEGLTPDDFFPPASGSRGKSRMNKHNAMKKVKCLFGDVVNIREQWLTKLSEDITSLIVNRNGEQLKVITNQGSFDDIQKIEQKYAKKIAKIQARFEKWNKKNNSFSFKLERLKSEKPLVYEINQDTIKLIVA